MIWHKVRAHDGAPFMRFTVKCAGCLDRIAFMDVLGGGECWDDGMIICSRCARQARYATERRSDPAIGYLIDSPSTGAGVTFGEIERRDYSEFMPKFTDLDKPTGWKL